MSLELKIEQLTKAVEALTAAMQNQVTTAAPVQTMAPVAVAAPVAPAMPAPPTFAPAPTPVQQAGVPFNDGKSLIEYVMGRYKALGPEKGAQIQNVLTSLGYQNINDIKPEHYAQFHAGVEAIQ